MAKQIRYSEPEGYFPKAIRDKIAADNKAKKKTPAKKTTKKK